MLEEYCNAHEIVRAGMSAATIRLLAASNEHLISSVKQSLHQVCSFFNGISSVEVTRWVGRVTTSTMGLG